MGKRRSALESQADNFGSNEVTRSPSPSSRTPSNRGGSKSRRTSPSRVRGHDVDTVSVSSAQHLQEPDESYSPPEDDWVSRAYQNMKPIAAQLPCSHLCTLILLAVAGALGLGLIILGALERYHPVVLLCPHCSAVVIAFTVSGSVLLLASVVGAASAVKRWRKVAAVFLALILIVTSFFFGLFVFVLIYRISPQLAAFESVWSSTVQNDPAIVCALQNDFLCSGFRSGCCYTNTTPLNSSTYDVWNPVTYDTYCFVTLPPTIVNGTTTTTYLSTVASGTFQNATVAVESVAWPPVVCAPSCNVSADQRTLCSYALQNRVDEYAVYVLLALSITVLLLVTAATLGCKSAFRPPPPPERIFLLAATDD